MQNIKYRITFALLCLTMLCCLSVEAQNNQGERLKVGLVLGGGGAKGAAEIGVLKSIEKIGIPIDYIAGTSIGSVIGGLYSCGYRADELDSLFRSQKWTSLLFDPQISLSGILGGKKVLKKLDDLIIYDESMDFDTLPIPFRCVAVDVKSFREVDLSHGNLVKAIRASMSIPFVFHPVDMDSMKLVDGGLLNNLPVDVVKRMGADVVIAIDLTQNKHKLRDASWDSSRGLFQFLEWKQLRPDLVKYNENLKYCDVYINPDLEGFDATSFSHNKILKMLEIGEKEGKKAEKKLRKLKKRIYANNK